MTSETRIVIAGYFGFGNAGDELILRAMLEHLHAERPSLRPTVVSGDPAGTNQSHGVAAVSWLDPRAQEDAVRRCDLVVLGGGGLFHDYWGFDPNTILEGGPSGLAHYAGPAALAGLWGKPLVLYAVGVGPLTTEAGQELTRAIVGLGSLVTVRDEGSRQALVELHVSPSRVRVTADPVFGLTLPALPAEGAGTRPRIAIAVRHWNVGIASEAWERELADGLDQFLRPRDAEAVFVPFQLHPGERENDAAVAERIRSRMGEAGKTRVLAPASADEAASAILSSDAVVAMRLHAAILAVRGNIPLVALAYDPKVTRLLEMLPRKAASFALAELSGGGLARRLEECLGERRDLSAEASSFQRQMADRASETARLAVACLDHPPAAGAEANSSLEILLRHTPSRERFGPAAVLARDRELPVAKAPVLPPKPYDLVVLSIIDWDFRFQRPQQLATQFARHGHRVYYLAFNEVIPAGGPRYSLQNRAAGVWRLLLRFRRRYDIYTGALDEEDLGVLEDAFEELAGKAGLYRVACLVQIPFWFPLARRLRERFGWTIVYDCMDDWATFQGFGPAVLALERPLVQSADVTLVSADRLAKKWHSQARRLAVVRNAMDLAHYVANSGPSELLGNVPRPIIGYFGAIAEWVDIGLLEAMARRFPSAQVVLAGEPFGVDLSPLRALPNVHLLGPHPYSEMPRLLSHFDVCIIPFVVNEITEATNPVKFYEYCFSGAPVVAPDLPELRAFSNLCYLSRNRDEFLSHVSRALDEAATDPRRSERRAVAAANQWEDRYLQTDSEIIHADAQGWRLVAQSHLDKLEGDLAAIHNSRLWPIARLYWRGRRKVASLAEPIRRIRSIRGGGAVAKPPETEKIPPDIRLARTGLEDNPRHDVVCLPIIDWDFRYQRPQQLMSQFARAGHRVFYVASRFRSSGKPFEIRPRAERVFEVSLRGPRLNLYRHRLGGRGLDRLFASLSALRRELSLGATSLVVELPFWWPLARRLREDFGWPVVYDCMDHHAGFSTNQPEMLAMEEALVSSADLVVASSSLLEESARARSEKVLLLRNACDFDHFQAAARLPANRGRPIVGYYGAIAEWFDSDLVARLAELHPEWDFLLVGSTYTADLSRLRGFPNVRFPGEKPYAEIPEWLASFDVAIIPFRRIPLTEATSPVKAYEMLAAGKPVVSVPIPEMAALAPLVRLASTPEEFAKEIASILDGDDPAAADHRRAFARDNTWERRFEILSPAVSAVFPKASIIVVTYNNLPLNRMCLESIFRATEWPNFEVLVVDNASSDGTREYLRRAEAEFPGLRALFNDRNEGFAAANNRGLAEATGEHLILLNNDTVVARGWLSALLRHLRRDRSIGLVGAVTNAIGNEAMIDVGYSRIEEMPAWALRHVRDHDGETFEIPMLAMFCAAMRRDVYEKVGPLDERFGVGMFEDDDYARRLREAGYRLVCARDSFVHHWMKASFKALPEEEYRHIFETNRRLFEEKWQVEWIPHAAAAADRKPG